MANFPPLKNYIFYCLDRAIQEHGLQDPFLDAGCGAGDVSVHVARRGWYGTAVDLSATAVERARAALAATGRVKVERLSLFDVDGEFRTVFLMDVIEHIADDTGVLAKVASLLLPGGHVVISVPSNPREWRWDDDFYGHVRRYTSMEMAARLQQAGLRPLLFWDFTFPFFWGMRRIYTRLKHRPAAEQKDMFQRTIESSERNAWDIPGVSAMLSSGLPLWKLVYALQFSLFRNQTNRGHEMIVAARKGD